jgi:alpha-beta hydrolase superfamily lysophospholipase
MTQPVIRRTEGHFAGGAGRSLFRRSWLPERAERGLVVVHGLAEHSGRYESLGAWFAERGCAVHALDLAGHGRSPGTRCHVRRFSDFHDDLEGLFRAVASEHPELPLFLVGHSMGGLIAASYLIERGPRLAGAVTSGAALGLPDDAPRLRLLAGRALRWVAPRAAFPIGIDAAGLSRDPAVARAYREDPLVTERITVSLAAELQSAIARTASGAPRVGTPLLLLHGEADPICPVDGSRRFFETLRIEARELHTYPELRHEIFNEPERESIYADALDWIRKRS